MNTQYAIGKCFPASAERPPNGFRTVRWTKVFNPRPLRNSVAAGILLVFSVLVFGIVFPNAFATWTAAAWHLSDELWPRLTRLEIDGFPGGVRKVARGSDVDIVVRADTSMPRVPKVVEIRYREEGGVRGRATMNRIGMADPSKDRYQEFLYTRRNVLSPITFQRIWGRRQHQRSEDRSGRQSHRHA